MRRITAGDWRERILFLLLLIFIVGYYWVPSTRALRSNPHDFVFYLGFLPTFLLFAPNLLRRSPPRSNLLALSLTFIFYLGASAFWTHGEAELSLTKVGLFTLATAVFVVGTNTLLSKDRRRLLTTTIVIAATGIAVVSLVVFSFGHRYLDGRLKSAIHFEHPNLLAHYLGFAALLCLLQILHNRRSGHGRTLPWGTALMTLLFSVVLTGGRASLVALVLGATVAVALSRDHRIMIIFAALIALSLAWGFVAGEGTFRGLITRGDAGRDVIYRAFIDRTADHRWTGFGIRAADNMRFKKGSWEFPNGQNIRHPHSAFVATYYYGGFLGLGLLVTLLFWASAQALKIARNRGDPTGAALLTFGVVCLLPDGHRLVSNPHLSSWLILWLPVAWIIAAERDEPPLQGRNCESVDKTPRPSSPATIGRTIFWVLFVFFSAQRLFHLGPDIDTPQMWRQCDTAQYIRAFAEDGIDLLHPSVCWLGNHKTTILEFPLPEAVAAVAYRVFGSHHSVARVIFLLFFFGSVFFLYRFVRELVDERLTRLTVLIYLVMPLALYFSRAIHIDFAALFFVHGMAYFFARALRLESTRLMWIGALFAALAMVIKAPYVLPLTLPLAVLVARHQRWRFLIRSLPILITPALVFGLWELHVHRVNSEAPDWFFIPHYRKMIQNGPWYFGTIAQRLDIRNWLVLGERFWREIIGTAGLIPATIGGIVLIRRRSYPVLAWCGGSVVMLLVFFNLTRLHNYYLIPFLAPVACLIAAGILWLAENMARRRLMGTVLVIVGLMIVAAEHVFFAETNYYKVLSGLIEGGEAIGRSTAAASLVVVSSGNLDCRSPHLLYHAGRYGWSITRRDLQPELVEQLVGLGAETLAIIDTTQPEGELATWLEGLGHETVELQSTPSKLYIYRLRPSP